LHPLNGSRLVVEQLLRPEALSFPIALIVSALLTPAAIAGATRLGLFDNPDGNRRVHTVAVPRVGGVGVFAGVLLALGAVLFMPLTTWDIGASRFFIGLALGATLMFAVGLADDIVGVRPWVKVVAQLAAAALLVLFGFSPSKIVLAYGMEVHLGWLAIPLFMLWVVAVTNAYNLMDGLNGLAGGIGVVAALAAAVAATFTGRLAAFVAAAMLAGALMGFLRYNFPTARVFLGDSGSMAVGFVLSAVLLRSSMQVDGGVMIAIPLFAMALPFVDTALAIVRRWLRNTPISGADARHIHHRLLAFGLSPRRAVISLWILSALGAGYGLLVTFAPPAITWLLTVGGAICVMVLAVYGSSLLAYHELLVATQVMLGAPRRARKLIQDQILATDLSHRITTARDVDELERVLEESGTQFGFLHMALISNDSEVSIVLPPLTRQRVWRFEYPVAAQEGTTRGFTLSVWCECDSTSRPYGAERVCRQLAPELSRWIAAKGPIGTSVVPLAKVPAGAEMKIDRISGDRHVRVATEV
jgi:UDP-GlcNAc:undecaprenyl-phosphate/decaprenyl-phosphate GlcNAc-1-phosphate transferase